MIVGESRKADLRWDTNALERSALCAALMGQSNGTRPDLFLIPQHRMVAETLEALTPVAGETVNDRVVRAVTALRQGGHAEKENWPAFVGDLLDAPPSAAAADLLATYARAAELDRLGDDIHRYTRSPAGKADPAAAVADIEGRIAAALEHRTAGRNVAPLVDLDVAGMLARGGWEPVPVLDDFLWDHTFTYLSGPSGSFKTWLMASWAVALTMGRPFIRQAVHGEHRILFVECESSVQILQRLPKVCAAYDVSMEEVLKRIRFVVPDARALRLEESAHAAHVMKLANDHGATWVFIDSLRRVTSLSEDRAEDMAALADGAFLPLRDAGHNVLLLEHPSKPMSGVTRNRKESMRGSGDKSAAADVVLRVDAIESERVGRVAALSVAKCRFAPERDEPLYLQIRPRDDVDGLQFIEVEEPPDSKRGRKPTALEAAQNVIRAELTRKPTLTYGEAIRYCVNANMSTSTAKRAWSKVQGSEVSNHILNSDPGSKVQKVHTPVGGEP